MFGLLGLFGVLIAGLSLDIGSDDPGEADEAMDSPEKDEAWGISSAFMDTEDGGGDNGGTEPDGLPVSNDLPDPEDPDQNLIGTDGADQLSGLSGQDRITAGAGDDYLAGGDGDDSLWGQDGNDHALGGGGADLLVGGGGDDTLWGDAGDDDLSGDAGNDLLAGCEGDDRIDAGEGDDTAMGGSGNDLVSGGAGQDVVSGGEGDDLVIGGTGADEVDGGAGNDTLWGSDAGQTDTDIDFLNGGAGDDVLHLGAGDYGNGGTGADSFTLQDFAPGGPLIQITDFNPAEDDLVVMYDQALHPEPQLTLDQADGATILLLDGVPLASLTNGAMLDLAAIRLQAA